MIKGIFHVNVNCTDFERSRAFYEMLGCKVVLDLPEHDLSDAGVVGLGVPDGATRTALLRIGDEPWGTRIDLIEWKKPKTEGQPYPHLYHTGIARIALRTENLAQVYEDLKAKGVEFLSEPQGLNLAGGERFVCFKDPDGAILELLEILR